MEKSWMQNEFTGKRVLVAGMARSGVAAAKLAVASGAQVTVTDRKSAEALGDALRELDALPIRRMLGVDTEEALGDAQVLVLSPGIPSDTPFVVHAREKGMEVVGELEFAARVNQNLLLAVTGTNGKTTTVTLLGRIFENAGRRVHVAGNIGYPLSAAVMDSKKGDVMVAEVSSFQLETTERFHPRAAAVLNVTEDHLNRHGTMEKYTALKRHVFDAQHEGDVAVLNYDDPACRAMAAGLKGSVAFFSRLQTVDGGAFLRDGRVMIRWQGEEKAVCDAAEIYIPGPHNLENAMAAALMAYVCGVPAPVIRHTLRTFKGVEHRIEFVRELDGVRYVNDSKATNVDSTLKAMASMTAPTVLLLGGFDKHVSFAGLAAAVAENRWIDHCVILGQTGDQIEAALKAAGYDRITRAEDLAQAVHLARGLAKKGGTVLLSPACASFDMFTGFEQRGEVFKSIVNDLT